MCAKMEDARGRRMDGRGRAGDTGEGERRGGSEDESRDRSPPTEFFPLPRPVAELLRGEVYRRRGRERPNKRNSVRHSFLTLGVGILPPSLPSISAIRLVPLTLPKLLCSIAGRMQHLSRRRDLASAFNRAELIKWNTIDRDPADVPTLYCLHQMHSRSCHMLKMR